MHGRLFWKVLIGLWLTFFVISQLLWVGFSLYGGRNDPPEFRLGKHTISLQMALATQALRQGGMAELGRTLSTWPQSEQGYINVAIIGDNEDISGSDTRLPPPDTPDRPVFGPPEFGPLAGERERPAWHHEAVQQVVEGPDGQRYRVSFNTARWRQDLMPDNNRPGQIPFFLHLPPPTVWIGGLGGLLFSAMLAWNLARPLSQLRAGFEQVSRGDLAVRIYPAMRRRHDEIADVARDFDAMVERLAVLVGAREQLLHDVSHELRSPLARLQLAIGLARQNPDNVESALQRMEREAQRMDKMIGEVLTLSRAENHALNNEEYFDLLGLVNAVVNDARYEAQVPGVEIDLNSGGFDDYTVKGSAELMRHALDNIIRNALRFSSRGQQVLVSLSRDEKEWCIGVADSGPGVEASKLSSIFDPFMRIDSPKSGKGYGLGLAIARKAVSAHGGRIEAENRTQGGLLIRLCIPRWQ
ncbi:MULTISPECIES: sensor histidine kinase [Dickeya]|uniref:histidine kinase n=1 Tax=Dickeya aquatica TaxID=1401087 RepID=A0A375A748_9GAMM|nr:MULTISPECIES: ATP-binding protein [Dickeya]SLM61928.1 Putative two-component system sensor kinase [Dickeya aquatica]